MWQPDKHAVIHVGFTCNDRKVDFRLTYDPAFRADVMTELYMAKFGVCEPEVVHLMCRVLQRGDVAFDVGANIGFFTCLMAQLVTHNGKVYAFEPAPPNLEKLRTNIALNDLDNVEVVEKGAWSACRELSFFLAHDSGINSFARTHESLSYVDVKTCRLSQYARKQRVKLIKLDIEGAELHALEGAGPHIGTPYIVCELNPGALKRMGASQRHLRNYMAVKGYETFLLFNDGRLPQLVPNNTLINPAEHNTNILFSTLYAVGQAWRMADG